MEVRYYICRTLRAEKMALVIVVQQEDDCLIYEPIVAPSSQFFHVLRRSDNSYVLTSLDARRVQREFKPFIIAKRARHKPDTLYGLACHPCFAYQPKPLIVGW